MRYGLILSECVSQGDLLEGINLRDIGKTTVDSDLILVAYKHFNVTETFFAYVVNLNQVLTDLDIGDSFECQVRTE